MNPFELPFPFPVETLVGLLVPAIVVVWTLLLVEVVWLLIMVCRTPRKRTQGS